MLGDDAKRETENIAKGDFKQIWDMFHGSVKEKYGKARPFKSYLSQECSSFRSRNFLIVFLLSYFNVEKRCQRHKAK